MNTEIIEMESPVTLPTNSTQPPDAIPTTVTLESTQPDATTSFSKTCFNGLNALSGVGMLTISYALATGGWLSMTLLLVLGSLTFYTGILIKRCMDIDPHIKTYPDIGYQAFGNKGRVLVSFAIYIELYLVATGFLILEGDNLHNIFPHMKFNIGSLSVGGRQSFVIMVGIIVMPTVWLNNMRILSYVSASGVLASFIFLGSIFSVGAFDGIGFKEKGTLFNLKGIPTSVSLYAFSYCSHPVFPTLYTSMRNKTNFSKVLLLCFLVCTFNYASIGVLGYLMFGSKVESQVTLNLPTNKISSKVAIYTTLLNPIVKYSLMVTPLVRAMENHFPTLNSRRYLNIVLRSGLVLSSIVVALAIPYFGYLLSLVGAFLSIAVAIILPCIFYMKISRLHATFRFESMFIWAIVIMGIGVMIAGTGTALKEIIGHLVQ